MDHEIPFDNPLPEPVRDSIRELYAPPADPRYWDHLHASVMARIPQVSPAQRRWRRVFHHWTRGGVLAAAVIILGLLSVIVMHTNGEQIRLAVDAIIHPNSAAPTTQDIPTLPSGELSGDGELEPHRSTVQDVIAK